MAIAAIQVACWYKREKGKKEYFHESTPENALTADAEHAFRDVCQKYTAK